MDVPVILNAGTVRLHLSVDEQNCTTLDAVQIGDVRIEPGRDAWFDDLKEAIDAGAFGDPKRFALAVREYVSDLAD